MHDTNTDTHGDGVSHVVGERIAALETTSKHHSFLLDDIASTLKEVVKLQALLANQTEENRQITKNLAWSIDSIHRQDKQLSNEKIKTDTIHDELLIVKKRNSEISEQVKVTNRVLGVLAAVIVITVPIVIEIIRRSGM
jgi:septal ring factor EnvC (AmiA/AmiB activator)